MDRQKGIAYCGLACALCSGNENCPGCRADGCTNKDSCKNLQCCRAKGLVYHAPGSLTGDYDLPGTEAGIMSMILHGR